MGHALAAEEEEKESDSSLKKVGGVQSVGTGVEMDYDKLDARHAVFNKSRMSNDEMQDIWDKHVYKVALEVLKASVKGRVNNFLTRN